MLLDASGIDIGVAALDVGDVVIRDRQNSRCPFGFQAQESLSIEYIESVHFESERDAR
jgi:hypothetical protein